MRGVGVSGVGGGGVAEMHGGEQRVGCDSGTHKHPQQELDP